MAVGDVPDNTAYKIPTGYLIPDRKSGLAGTSKVKYKYLIPRKCQLFQGRI